LRHRGIDSAAALTFFSALGIFPAALAAVSAFGIGHGRGDAATTILDIVDEVAQQSTVETLKTPLTELFSVSNPGIAFTIGIVLALWSLSSYATAFGRAVNSVYEVQEGRQIWTFRGLMVVLAAFLLVVFGAIVALLVATPRLATAIGKSLGIGEPWITVWSIGRWPVLLALVTLAMAVLYYFTPNVRHDRMRWVSAGALFAIVTWAIATTGFGIYVSTIGQYDRVYGWLGGGVVLLLWLYLTNLVLVLGAEVDAEVVRLRQLSAGVVAEEVIQLPMRNTRRNLMLARQLARDVTDGRAIRSHRDASNSSNADRG
jgi:membrane protein